MTAKPHKDLRFFWLAAFIAVSEHGSQVKASKALQCSQSKVSRAITELEEWLGRVLLSSDVPPDLTEAGQSFLPVAREIVSLLADHRAVPGAQN